MDQKGSLVDTNLKIYPSKKLINFIKTIPSDQLPHNLLQIKAPNSKTTFKSYKLEDLKAVQLNTTDIDNLKKIRDSFLEVCKNKSIKNDEQKNDEHKDTKVKEQKDINIEETLKENIEFESKPNKECKNNDSTNINKKSSKDSFNSDIIEPSDTGPYLVMSDIDWLYVHINNRRTAGEKDVPYLHTLLEDASIKVPENETIKRNPILEARCVKLRAQQEAREYRKMTKSVDNVRMRFPEDSISYQMKQLNRHLIAIGQFIISIFAGFLFGFRGVEWMVGNLDFGFRLLLGVMCALVIALAEIYFLAKKLNEELCVPETVQLGGPVKFADQDSYIYKESESKPHQD